MACAADLPQALSENRGQESEALEMCPGRAPGEDNLLRTPANSLTLAWPRGTKRLALAEAASVGSGHRKAEPEGPSVVSQRMFWTSGQAAPLRLLPADRPAFLFRGQHMGVGKLLLNLLM